MSLPAFETSFKKKVRLFLICFYLRQVASSLWTPKALMSSMYLVSQVIVFRNFSTAALRKIHSLVWVRSILVGCRVPNLYSGPDFIYQSVKLRKPIPTAAKFPLASRSFEGVHVCCSGLSRDERVWVSFLSVCFSLKVTSTHTI